MTLCATASPRLHLLLLVAALAILTGGTTSAQQHASPVSHLRATDILPTRTTTAETPLAAASTSSTVLTLSTPGLAQLRTLDHCVIDAFPLPGGETVDLEVQAFSLFTRDAQIIAMTEEGAVRRPLPDITLYRGTVRGVIGSWVYLAVEADGLSGTIITGGTQYSLYTDVARNFGAGASRLVTIAATTPDMKRYSCSLTEDETVAMFRGMAEPKSPAAKLDTLSARIAIEADLAAFQHYGSVAKTENYITARMGESTAIYERDVAITLVVPFLRVWTTQDPFPGNSDKELLNVFTTYWRDNMDTVQRSLATLISRKPISANGVSQGLAWLDRLCSTTHGYSIVKFSGNDGFIDGHTGVLAHELGHNFASPHTHSCTWNPAIDSCYTAEPINGQAACFTKAQQHLILGGGEMMSYCHLTYGNANHYNIFRDRTGALIRARAEAALCMEASSTIRHLELTAPLQTFDVCAGQQVDLAWDAQGVNDMSIHLSRNGGVSYDTVLVRTLERTRRNWTWNIPGKFPAGTSYRLRIIDNKNGTLVSEMPVNFTILEGVYIVAQNTWRNVCVGQGARFEVVAKGPGTLRYEWKKNGTVIPGAVTDTIWIQNTTLNDNGSLITCTITSDCGSITSEAALLKVFSNPVILQHPVNDSVCVGGTAVFRVVADGPELTYKWLTQQGYVPNETGPELVVKNVQGTKAYWCEVSSPCGKTNSGTGIVVVPATGIDKVLTPAPYQELVPGQTFRLCWRQFCVASVKLEYSLDGTVWNTIVASHPADSGWYEWTVVDTETQNGSFRISQVGGASTKISPTFKIVKKPLLTLGSDEVNFGLIPVGSASEKTINVINGGKAALIISKTEITGNGEASVVQGAPITLQPAQSAPVRVSITPTATGPLSGSLRIEHNAAGSPAILPITGDAYVVVSARPLPAPDGLALHQNYPNPVSLKEHAETMLTFDLPQAQPVTLTVVNTLGVVVRTMHVGMQASGRHSLSLPLSGLPTGTYLVRMLVPGAIRTRVMQLVR